MLRPSHKLVSLLNLETCVSRRNSCLFFSKWSSSWRKPHIDLKSNQFQKQIMSSPSILTIAKCSYSNDNTSNPTLNLNQQNDDIEPIKSLLRKCLDDAMIEQNIHQSLLVSNDVIQLFCYSYNDLSPEWREKVLLYICKQYGVDQSKIMNTSQTIFSNIKLNRASATCLQTEERMRYTLQPMYSHLFKLIGRLNNGVKFLTEMRNDALEFASKSSGNNSHYLRDFSNQLKNILSIWFSVGLLRLTRITWETPADILEKIAKSEAVHLVRSWTDLKKRLGPDRRCYAFFHSSMPRIPLLLLHVALTTDITEAITDIVDYTARGTSPDVDLADKTTAMFYSITSTQKGLQGIEFGVHMIRAVAQELRQNFPSLVQFSSLSPIPRFNCWLQNRLSLALKEEAEVFLPAEMGNLARYFNASSDHALLEHIIAVLAPSSWMRDKETADVLKAPLLRLCAEYLHDIKSRGNAFDPVANFHLRNGATLWRINWLADPSVKGLNQSLGIMVNYRYFLDHLEDNSREYIVNKAIPVSPGVLALKSGNFAQSVL